MHPLSPLLRSLIAVALASSCTLLAPARDEIYGAGGAAGAPSSGGGGVAGSGGGGEGPTPACGLASDACVVDIRAGMAHTCVVRGSDRAVFCWGLDEEGAASGTPGGVVQVPAQVDGLPAARALASGSAHNCILSDDEPGQVWCWPGERGTGPEQPSHAAGNQTFVDGAAVSVGHLLTTVLDEPGAVSTWVPGDATTQKHAAVDLEELHAGTSQSCGRTSRGEVYCWDFYAATFPFAPALIDELGPVDVLAGSGTGTSRLGEVDEPDAIEPLAVTPHCAWSSDAGIVCFQGLGGPIAQRTIANDATVAALAVGMVHGCAVLEDCTVACWGGNHAGQLGRGLGSDPSFVDHPLAGVAGSIDAYRVAAGAEHSCALRRDGSVWCWGDGGDSQLGVLGVDGSDVPIAIDMSTICP